MRCISKLCEPNLIVVHVSEFSARWSENSEFFHEITVKHTVRKARTAHLEGRHHPRADQLVQHRGFVDLNQDEGNAK